MKKRAAIALTVQLLILSVWMFGMTACSHNSSAPHRRAPINGWPHKLKRDNPGGFHARGSNVIPF